MSNLIVDIVKNPELFENLSKYNSDITKFMDNYRFDSNYDFSNKIISPWFNPKNVRNLGLSRTYPEMDACQYRREYSLYLHCSNYLAIFLINLLYANGCCGEDILIEDIGGGMGWLFLYLNKLGFNNFHLVENFSQCSQESAKQFIFINNINCQINNFKLNPVVVNNVGVPGVVLRELNPKTELIVFYTNRDLERDAYRYLSNNGYNYLCRDTDDLAVAYCRNDRLEEFRKKLVNYAV